MKNRITQILVNLFPLVLFSLISILYFGYGSMQHLNTNYIGSGNDPLSCIWAFSWWKYCLTHHFNPFFNRIVWYPYKYNLVQQLVFLWGNFILIAPIVLSFGPVVGFNISTLAAPALAGWTAFFLLRYISKSYWPSIIGAYFFGFSSFMIGHILGHLMLITIFLIPIIVLLTIKFYKDEISSIQFCILTGFCLALQCYIASETFATLVFFGCLNIVIAFLVFENNRLQLFRLMSFICLSLLVTLILVAPFLSLFFLPPKIDVSLFPPVSGYVNDLLSPIIPSNLFLIHININSFIANATKWHNYTILDASEYNGYFGLPLIIICIMYFIEFWKSKITKFFFFSIILIFICSLGYKLNLFGIPYIWMPWQLASYLPLMKYALPVKFSLYISLYISVIISLWLTNSDVKNNIKNFLIIISIIFLIPSFQFFHTNSHQKIIIPKLISSQLYKQWLKPNDVVVILPYAYQGNSMLWQFKSNFYFAMAGGYLGYTPEEFSSNPTVLAFLQYSNIPNFNLTSQPNLVSNTENFLLDHKVKAIFVYDNKPTWKLFFNKLGLPPINVDGVDLYLTKFLNIPSFEINFLNWSGFENDAQNYWIWCSGNSKIYIHARKNGLLTLSCQINAIKIPRTIYISLNNKHIDTLRLNNTATGHFKIAFQAKKNTNYSLHFYSPQKPIQPIPNSRWLSFAIMNYKVKLLPSRSLVS